MPLKACFFCSNLRFGGRQQPLGYDFHALAKRRFFPHFSSTRRNMLVFKPFLQYFATGTDTASCQDYEEYEFVEPLPEEIQIIDLFTHCKLQPHKTA